MASTENVGIELMEEIVDQVRKSFNEMTSHRESLPNTKSIFEDIQQHFHDMKRALEQKFDELVTKERAFEKKNSEHHTLLEEREGAVGSKEQSLYDCLQEVRDAAVSAIIEARKKSNEASPMIENKVSSSVNGTLNAHYPDLEESIPVNRSSHSFEATACKVEPIPLLKQLCEDMNLKGLLKFFSDNRRNITPLRDELPIALRSASEPANLVLKTLEEFYPQNLSDINPTSKEYSNLQALRRTCLLLMESATTLLTMAEPGHDHLLSDETKQRARVIANEWKHKLAGLDLDASNGLSLEAQAFLQLLVTFNISAEFDEDELCKLVIAMSRRRRQAPELCLAVGLAHKSQEVVGALIAKGRLIDAVHFSYFFRLVDAFPLVPLLKQYMDDSEETFTRSIAAGLDKEAANQELSALKTVIRCIGEYKIQEEYPPLPLQNRIDELERSRTNTKRTADRSNVPAKKHRSYGGHAFCHPPYRFSGPTVYERTQYYPGPDRRPYAPYHHQANALNPYRYPDRRASPFGAPNYGGYAGLPMQPVVIPCGNLVSSGMQPSSSNYGGYI